jgi:hypothetical protein
MGNIVLNKTATAGSSVVPYTPQKAVDGSVTPFSRWLCNATPGWLRVDPGALYMVNRWVVKHMPVAGWTPDYVISDFRLQGSNDNINWSDIDAVAGNTAAVTDRTVAPVVFRYFRVYVTRGLKNNYQMISLVEFELYQAYSSFLTNLTISAGTLTPAFNPNTLAYTATVNPDVASINVTPTAQDPQAIVKVNGAVVVSGQPKAVALSYGSNTITVNVTDGSGAQKNYILTVTRPASFLSSLTVQSGGVNVPLVPGFVKTTQAYTASVVNTISGVTFTPTAEKPNSTITINNVTVASGQVSQSFPLVVGANVFTINVTADGVSFPYTVTITRAGSGVSLLLDHVVVNYSGRSIPSGSVNVPMNATDLIYPATVPTGAGNITISPFANDSTVVIKVNNVQVASGGTSGSITLASSGVTAVSITVTSPDGSTTRSYTLNVSKG